MGIYKHYTKFLIHGTSQCLTNSPMITSFISCTLFDYNKSEAYVMKILTPFGDHCVLLNMVRFVNDSMTITDGNKTNTVLDLLINLRRYTTMVLFIMVLRREFGTFQVWLPLYLLLFSIWRYINNETNSRIWFDYCLINKRRSENQRKKYLQTKEKSGTLQSTNISL